jgi:hypothetical protein
MIDIVHRNISNDISSYGGKMKTPREDMPQSVARRIASRIAKRNEPVVVTSRGGKPSRVFGYDEYKKMVELPNRVKPWEGRKGTRPAPDPLGAVDAGPPVGLSRKNLYEED